LQTTRDASDTSGPGGIVGDLFKSAAPYLFLGIVGWLAIKAFKRSAS
jgi:hypothetical protein